MGKERIALLILHISGIVILLEALITGIIYLLANLRGWSARVIASYSIRSGKLLPNKALNSSNAYLNCQISSHRGGCKSGIKEIFLPPFQP